MQTEKSNNKQDILKSKISDNHIVNLAKTLNILRKKSVLCDVAIVVKDSETNKIFKFPAHQCVLVVSSGYFRDAFGVTTTYENEDADEYRTSKRKGNAETLLEIPFFISSIAMETILTYCYLGMIAKTTSPLEEIMNVAHKLEMSSLQRYCLNLMRNRFQVDDLWEIYGLSNQIPSSELRYFALDKTTENFDIFIENKKFLDLSANELQEWIDHRNSETMKNKIPELNYFKAVKKWWESDPNNRRAAIRDILKTIQYNKIPQPVLANFVLKSDIINTDEELREIIEVIILQLKKDVLKRIQNKSSRISRYEDIYRKSGEECLLVVGGSHFDQFTSQIERLIEESWSWNEYNFTPTPIAHHCVGVVGNVLYLAGGEEPAVAGVKCLHSLWSFNPDNKLWLSLPPMQHARSHFYMGVWENHLIAIGGNSAKATHASVEKFSIQNKRWEFTQCLSHERHSHAGCDVENFIYITGGVVKPSSSPDLLRFSPASHRWTRLNPMLCARSNHCMAASSNKLFVFGGEIEFMEISNPVSTLIESFCLISNQWSKVERKIDYQGIIDCSCVSMKGRFCFVGGCHNNLIDYKPFVTTYDPINNEWSTLPNLPRRIRGCACAILFL